MITENRMKKKILSGEPAYGVSFTFPAPELVEYVAAEGFDWILIDCEHGSHSFTDVHEMVMACEISGVTPIVRPASNDPALILRYLDRGAMGLQIPHINTAEEARAAVDAAKFYPEGSRGIGGGRKNLGLSAKEYPKRANEEILVCVQIEHIEGANNIDEILKVDGVDVFFLGTNDLSQSMGHPGERDHPEVETLVDDLFSRIHAAGKASGTPGGPALARKNIERGVNYQYTHIPTFVSHYGQHYMKTVRGE